MKGELTQEQYEDAQQYLQIRNNYLCAKGLLGAVYDDVCTSSDPNKLEQWVQKTTNHYQAVQEALKEAQCLYRQYNLYAALQSIVIEDQSLPHLVSSLRVALNALQKYFDSHLENKKNNIGQISTAVVNENK
ncbi:hypothetical protein ABID39_001052 [Bartonella japonica]|uniref:Uncharacterized protein n=1 Tax=Bartonella japonica TaxID=357761 RepID=A0ABV2FPE5_9HYPH